MIGFLNGLRQWTVAILAAAVAVLVALHLHDAKVHAADRWQLEVEAQNRAALADSNRVLKSGWVAHLAVIAKDSASLAAMGRRYSALAAELAGLKKEKAKPVVVLSQRAEVELPARVLGDLSPGPSPGREGSNSEKRYREDDTCGGSEFHFAMTMHGDSMRFEKSMRIDFSSMLVTRADGKREFRGRSPCPWITIGGIEGAVFEDAAAVPERKAPVWSSRAAYAIYGAALLRVAQVALPAMGIK